MPKNGQFSNFFRKSCQTEDAKIQNWKVKMRHFVRFSKNVKDAVYEKCTWSL